MSQTLTDISIPPVDIQTILIVLGRRTLSHEKGESHYIDLMKTNLRMVSLFKVNLEYANFWRANLSGANLSRANLSRADLSRANLMAANLWRANLSEANLSRANLSGAILFMTNLIGTVNLTIKQLFRAKTLYEAKLDLELMEQIKEKYPHLLERPEWLEEIVDIVYEEEEL